MKVEVQDHSDVKKTLTIEVDADAVKKESDEVVRRYTREAQLPGFRRGKVPVSVVRGRFKDQIEQDVRERLLWKSFGEAAKDRGYRPLGDPKLDEVHFEEGEPFRFTTTFEILPEFEVKDYREVEVSQPAVSVPDDAVDKFLDELRESRARFVTHDAAAGSGDYLVADLHGEPEDGEPFDREKAYVEVGSEQHLPDFNEAVTGGKAGDTLEFSVTFPEDFAEESMRGKSIAYVLNVHEVKRKELPELDDEFAKDLGEFDTLEELRDRVRQDLTARAEGERERETRQKILDKILLENPIPLPEILVEEEVRFRLEDAVRRMMMQGMDPQTADLDWEKFREGAVEPSRKTVHARLILEAIARAESLEVQRKELDQRIAAEAARLGEKPAEVKQRLKEGHRLEALTDQLLREKALDLVTSVANISTEEI